MIVRFNYYVTLIFFLVFLAKPAFSEVVKIGMLTDLSGPAAYWGAQARLGAELAVKELRTGGKAVEIIFGDNQLDAKKAVTEAHKLINVDQVDALYSEFTTTSTAASFVASKHKKLFLYSAAAASLVKQNPSAFKTYLDYVHGCKKIATQWKKSGIKKVGILKAEAEFGELCEFGAKTIYPDLIVVEYQYGANVNTQILILKTKGVDAILNATYEPDMLRMMKSMSTLQYNAIIGANEDALAEKAIEQYPALSQQATLFGFSGISKEFKDKIKMLDPKNDLGSIQAAALAYTHIRQLYVAISQCKKNDLKCQIATLSLASSDPVLDFKGWKDRIATFELVLKSTKD